MTNNDFFYLRQLKEKRFPRNWTTRAKFRMLLRIYRFKMIDSQKNG